MWAGMRKTASATSTAATKPIDRRQPCGRAAHGQEVKERADRDGRGQRGEERVAQRVEVLNPSLWHWGMVTEGYNCRKEVLACEWLDGS